MTSFEMILTCDEAAAFDRFFWDFVEDQYGDSDAGISLTAFAGLGSERRIVQVEQPAQADAFRAAWTRARGRPPAAEPAARSAPSARASAESSAAPL